MPLVDFSNPYLRQCLKEWGAKHKAALDDLRAKLPGMVADSAARESASAAAERRPPRDLAAVLDIDEVLLCNIHGNVDRETEFHPADYFAGPDGSQWPRAEHRLNPLLPGVRELLECARALNLELFLVTGRCESIREETIENFELVGIDEFFWDLYGDHLMLCPDAEKPEAGQSIRPFKEGCRRKIEATHRIVVNVGDQVSDLGHHGDTQWHLPHPFYFTH